MADGLDWRFSHVVAEKEEGDVTEADILSTVEFDGTGENIAVGDKGGRILVFTSQGNPSFHTRGGGASTVRDLDYRPQIEFQSHEPEFDYLKSLEIEERINKIKWLGGRNRTQMLLSTNDKTIKLWKIHEKKAKSLSFSSSEECRRTGGRALRLPRLTSGEHTITNTSRRVFANGHAYHINSISLNSDGETFISSDDLRVNLWNLEINDQSFNIVDIKPANLEELTEVITSSEFHPFHCNIFMYSSSKGTVKLADMRDAALCDHHSKLFEEPEDPSSAKSFFSEIVSSISDIKFSRDGRYFLSRDYLTVKVWDLNMEKRPLCSIPVHEQLRPKLCDLYENDFIFDKFECSFSHDNGHFLTGSYNNYFHVFDTRGRSDACFEASRVIPKKKLFKKQKDIIRKAPEDINVETFDFRKKVLHTAWHPSMNLCAVAAANMLFFYTAS